MEQMLEMILKHGVSIVFNVWFMFRIEATLKKSNETSERVLAFLEAQLKGGGNE